MTTTTVEPLDVQRATAILNAAAKNNQYPPGAIPESEEAKISEAEKLVSLALQAHKVAMVVGKGNVPNYQAIMDVMFEANVTLGIEDPPQAPATPDAPKEEGGRAEPGSSADAAPSTSETASQPPPSEPSAEAVANEEDWRNDWPHGYFIAVNKPDKNEIVYTHAGCPDSTNGRGTSFVVPHDGVDATGGSQECPACVQAAPVVEVDGKAAPKPICGNVDKAFLNVICELEPGHDPPHIGGNQTWDSFLEQPPQQGVTIVDRPDGGTEFRVPTTGGLDDPAVQAELGLTQPYPDGQMQIFARPVENAVLFTHMGCPVGAGKLDETVTFPLGDIDVTGYEGSIVECTLCHKQVPVTDIQIEPTFPPASDLPPAPVEQQVGPPVEVQPVKDETWLDANNNPWTIDANYGGGPQVQVRSSTGEVTVVPRGFLKGRAEGTVPPSQPQTPSESPSPQPSSPDPSASVTSSPEPTTASVLPDAIPMTEPSGGESAPLSSPNSPSASPEASSSSDVPEAPATVPVDDDGGDVMYRELLDNVDMLYQPPSMPTPMDLETPPASMPEDLTTVPIETNRQLHSQFNALASRCRYLHSVESAKERDCNTIRRKYLKVAKRAARQQLPASATETAITELAEEDADVQTWFERSETHHKRAVAWKTFFDIYTENVSVLSRDYTMREAEQQGA